MHVAVAGAGPAGLMISAALARRGDAVTLVDRDPGPGPGPWERRGVMQFEHAHAFRPQVHEVLASVWPEGLACWEVAAEPMRVPPGPDGALVGMRSRRATFERALRASLPRGDGPEIVTGHVDDLVGERGRVVGLVVDGRPVAADLVVDATGRRGLRRRTASDAEGDCGIAYVNRCYRLHPGAEPGPMTMPIGWVASFDGYQVLLFLHERGHFTVVFVRATVDDDLRLLHDVTGFEAACRAVPALARWTDPERAAPTTGVMVGGALRNVYRGPRTQDGLVALGDAVATTTPTAGRGIAMAALQVEALLGALDRATTAADLDDAVRSFDTWCDERVRPWVEDHVEADTARAARFRGADVDPDRLTTSDIAAAGEADPSMMPVIGPYLGMAALPATLEPLRSRAREVYASGWRPPYGEGPTRGELVDALRRAARV